MLQLYVVSQHHFEDLQLPSVYPEENIPENIADLQSLFLNNHTGRRKSTRKIQLREIGNYGWNR